MLGPCGSQGAVWSLGHDCKHAQPFSMGGWKRRGDDSLWKHTRHVTLIMMFELCWPAVVVHFPFTMCVLFFF